MEPSKEIPISPSIQASRKLEWKSEIPKPVMLLGGDEAEEEAKKAGEYFARHYPAEGRANVEALKTSTERHQLVHFAREVMRMYEDVEFHPEPPISDYRLEDIIASLKDRQSAMENLRNDLILLGIIVPGTISEDGKTAIFKDSGFEYRKTPRIVEKTVAKHYDRTGKLISIEKAEQMVEGYEIGTDDQRKELGEILKQEVAEMMAKQDLVKMLRWVWNQTENLEGLVEFYYKGSLTAEAMQRVCSAIGRTAGFNEEGKRLSALIETAGGVKYGEGSEFGDAMSAALKCFEIAAVSEDVKTLEDLLKRPGIKELFGVDDREIDDLFIDPEDRKGDYLKNENYKTHMKILYRWIGRPWQWNKGVRSGKGDLEKGLEYDEEGNPTNLDENLRGSLTEKGNILCDSDWPSVEHLFQQTERFLGGGPKASMMALKDANDAAFLAWMVLRVSGMATDYGRQLYNKEAEGLAEGVFHDMGVMTSCDRVKVMYINIFRFIYSLLKTEIRDHGPDGSFGKYPDRLAVHYFKHWTGETKNGLRTYQEMRWGYRKEKLPLTDKEGKKVMEDFPEEEYFRLRELPWKKLSPKAFNAAALGPYIAGRKELGLFQYAMRTNWKFEEIKDYDFARKIAKHMGIALSPQVVFDGKFRGIYREDKEYNRNVKPWIREQVRNYKKKYVYAFWDGLRSLPQWKEWLAMPLDRVKSTARAGEPKSREPIRRIKYRLGQTGILTPQEAMALPEDALLDSEFS